MRFLIDASVLSEPLRERPHRKVVEKLERLAGHLATASVVWHEVGSGVERLPASRRRRRFEAYLAEVAAQWEILPYDRAAAGWHAAERARLERAGRPAEYADGQIAAVARVHGLVLVTRNVADFAPFRDLTVENWHVS